MRPNRRAGNLRLLSVGMALLVAWAAVGYRLVHLQGIHADEYSARGQEQRLRREALAAPRGTIFDRDGHELAVTVDAITIYANPHEVTQPKSAAELLAPVVGKAPAEMQALLEREVGFVYLARQLDRRLADEVRSARLPGIYLTTEPKRVYPAGSLAAHVLGLVQVDTNVGLEGLEYQYHEILSGRPGELLVERDPEGRTIPQGEFLVVPAEPGSDLRLTIDREIQFIAERALAAVADETGAGAASAVVLHVPSGEVLAMANVPGFDPNARSGDPSAYRNRAVTDTYEPGSTQKLVTVAAALNEGLVTPLDTFRIPEQLVIHDKTYTDVGDHGPELTVNDIVAYSSNMGTILIQQELGNERLHGYLEAFGLGQGTGLDFPGEASGLLRPANEWCETTCGPSTAIGYRVSVTLLQMAAAYATIANDGVWIQPHLVKEVFDGQGSRRPVEPAKRPVVSRDTAAVMRILLEGVVTRGTGWRAAVEGYRVGGKTGTTEKYLPDVGEYSQNEIVASFIGMGPVEHPELVVAVLIDSPDDGQFGGEIAAPVFSEIMLAALHQLGVPPDA